MAIYQLAISNFASSDIRTVSERHLLLLGDLLLLLPLLLMPLGSRLLVWRPLEPTADSAQEYTSRSNSRSRLRSGSDTGIRAWGTAHQKVHHVGSQYQEAETTQEEYNLQAAISRHGCLRGGVRPCTEEGIEEDGKDESPRSVISVAPATPSAASTMAALTPKDALGGPNRRMSAVQRSQPIPIRSKFHLSACAVSTSQGDSPSDPSLTGCYQHSSRGSSAAAHDSLRYIPAAISRLQKPDPLPESTRLLPDAGISCDSAADSSRRHTADGAPCEPNLSPLQCTQSVDFWMLFFVFGTGAGCGLLLINNIGTPRYITQPISTSAIVQ